MYVLFIHFTYALTAGVVGGTAENPTTSLVYVDEIKIKPKLKDFVWKRLVNFTLILETEFC